MMEWSRTGMFIVTSSLTFIVALLCMIFIHVKESSNEKNHEAETLFKKLQLKLE